ncbi:hypothetical protein ACH5RR_019667 [Cinchona calisaya]|uniref:MBD domain-containing protein n=1 Tax=Cinchona calisaya TaxID=153742 RepID=A0ABD2ZQH1_9GENT
MGHEKSSYDWLPAGWKVQVRVRNSGKKDKCYVDPSNEHKFYSKPEVLRYLKNVLSNPPVCEETQNGSTSRRSAIKSVLKEEVAEGLPAGWIKETRTTQKGNKIRRDSYYIDPVTGHLFRSMKEVLRYLDTGKMGKLASKPNEKSPINLESTDNSLPSFAETEEKRTAESKAEKQFIGNPSPKSDSAAMDNISPSEADKLEEREKKESSSESTSTVTEVPQENLQIGNGSEGTKRKKRKLNDKKGPDLPRRTSKRLAGIEVNLSLESKVHTRVRRAAGRQISGTEVNCADKGDNLAGLEEETERVRSGIKADKNQESLDVLPTRDVTSPEKHAKEGVAECKGDEKPEVPLNLCLEDLWKDPCIEFAIKTLTGEIEIPIRDEIKAATSQGSSSNLADALPGSSVDLPPNDIWSDPCFEFAVKTLTGEIDTNLETILRQPSHNSSDTIGDSGLTMPNAMSAGFSSASVSSRHSNVAETPANKQRL